MIIYIIYIAMNKNLNLEFLKYGVRVPTNKPAIYVSAGAVVVFSHHLCKFSVCMLLVLVFLTPRDLEEGREKGQKERIKEHGVCVSHMHM